MPLISIVVPTHNRADYAVKCIEAVLRFDTNDLQLVMTDTSTDQRLYDMLHAHDCNFLDDPRFIYRKINTPSNLTLNHNDALLLAAGDYVCVIGDDDCITGAAIDAARWASIHHVEVVSQTLTASYAWPDFRSILARGGHAARLYVPRHAGAARWRYGEADLTAALARAFQGTDEMPRCYHGIVSRKILTDVRNRTGAYFHGSSPDMSGAVALSCLVDRYCEVDLPLTIPGASGGSNSGRSAMNTHKGELSAEVQTTGFEKTGWTRGVPSFFAVETVWAHAGLETLKTLRPEWLVRFNYYRLLALCKLRHPEYEQKTNLAMQDVNANLSTEFLSKIERVIRSERWARRKYLLRRLIRPTAANGRRYFGKLQNIFDASICYEDYALKNKMSFINSIKHIN
jgi:hypothetical protein